jgi:hypothetical protein
METPAVTPARKPGRVSVPSWSDVLLGVQGTSNGSSNGDGAEDAAPPRRRRKG